MARVAHGGRAADEARRGAVERGEAAEAAQDEGDVAAEDPAVHMRLVDDDVPQCAQHVRPLRMVGHHGLLRVRVRARAMC